MNEYSKRQKLDSINNGDSLGSMDSSVESRKRVISSKSVDFTLPSVKRKTLATRGASLHHSDSIEIQQLSQVSSGYSSGLSCSTSSSNQNISPRKRKSSSREGDENFYNSFSFISPVKLRASKEVCAKKILKEKCSSENVIRCSTPVQNNSNKNRIWRRYQSHHPENVKNPTAPFTLSENIPTSVEEASFDEFSSFDLTASFDVTNNEDHRQLFAGSIRTSNEQIESHLEKLLTPTKKEPQPSTSTNLTNKKINYFGREKFDIIGKLSDKFPSISNNILSYLDFKDKLSLSHVSTIHRNIVRSNKIFETDRINYLENFKKNEENLYPGKRNLSSTLKETPICSIHEKKDKSRLGAYNKNILSNSSILQISPPVSPSRRKFHENQKVARTFSGKIMKCPRCKKPAKIQVTQIRKSPRKKRNVMKISYNSPGRVQKKASTSSFFQQPSLLADSLYSESMYTTFPGINSSPESSSSLGSPSRVSSDESSGNESIYDSIAHEYAECTGKSCNYKFCPKCECKSHPRQDCKELSPNSPIRKSKESSIACTSQSFKRLKRLIK